MTNRAKRFLSITSLAIGIGIATAFTSLQRKICCKSTFSLNFCFARPVRGFFFREIARPPTAMLQPVRPPLRHSRKAGGGSEAFLILPAKQAKIDGL
jgi:hypothetical protein